MAHPGITDFRGTERFQVLSRLGEGGMGVVYEAYDREQRTRVALKTMRALGGDAVLRFKNEFRALQDLQHPNLISLGELISEGGVWFFTMELIDGVDFRTWVRGFEEEGDRPSSVASTRENAAVSDDDITPIRALRAPTPLPAPLLPAYDEPRLRRALAQLADGLHALHRAGKVHRDIKPSNILVTHEGRVVLLDFGLAADARGPGGGYQGFSDPHAVGTADYMAPEQAAAKAVGPEGDWYSVGVLLYEALTGRLPFVGAPLQVMVDKQRFEPVAPRKILPSVSADLDALCVELLRFDPQARPSGEEVLRRLGVDPSLARESASAAAAAPFVGRVDELETLRAAFEESRARAVTLIVHGESGVGKSALVQRFLRQLAGERFPVGEVERKAVVLAGRCHERESVPYKALDDAVDALSRLLMRLPRAESAALLPPHVALLAQVFPVLRRVEAVSKAPLASDGGEPLERRTRLFAALRELLARLAARQPVVVAIDDLQWADADSLALLAELLRPPAPPLFLIATVRVPAEGARAEGPRRDVAAALPGDVRQIRLARLSPVEAREMVGLLLRRAPIDGLSAEAIAEEAGGHPLFIDELVRHAAAGGQTDGPVMLEEALWGRIARLDEPTRRLLELVAVAGVPLAQAVAARASDGDEEERAAGPSGFGEFARRMATLRAANLVRTSGARGSDTVEPYHDRVREAVLWHLDAHRLRACHQRLAVALEAAEQADPEGLAIHWHGAGDDERATRYAAFAAAQAADAFAFERAARLYRMALEVRPLGNERRALALTMRLGDVLAGAGRGAEAAEAYLAAARSTGGGESLELRRKAAEQLLRSGFVDDGLHAIEPVLDAVGLPLPPTPRDALRSLLWRRAQVRLRGYRFRERDPAQIPALALTRVDVAWSVAIGLALVDNVRGAWFQTRCLLLALQAGEPSRVARALAMEAAYAAVSGERARRRVERLQKVAEDLARRIDDPQALGLSIGAKGMASYLRGRWKPARENCERAERILRDRCVGVAWELHTVQMYALLSMLNLGQVKEMARLVPARLREAEERGDLIALIGLRTLANFSWLAGDDVAGARREVDTAEKLAPRNGYFLVHNWILTGRTQVDLYDGDARGAYQRIVEAWPVQEKSLVMRIQMVRIIALWSRGRAAVALAASLTPGAERSRLLAEAARDARAVERAGPAFAVPHGRLLRAGIAAVAGDRPAARALCEQALALFESSDMALHAQVARRCLAPLVGADEARHLLATSDAWMASEEILSPSRVAAVIAPGLPQPG